MTLIFYFGFLMFQPKYIDFKNSRIERQRYNDNLVYNAIKTNNITKLYKIINNKELDKILNELNLTLNELINLCIENDIMNKILSGRISKCASRQGNLDEIIQLSTINELTTNYNIYIEKSNVIDYIPMEDGLIIKKDCNKIDKKSLKSFDAKVSGNINGFIFAKIVYGNGGHQDNVFEEANNLCEWIIKFHKNKDTTFILIIDTDLITKINKLIDKYKHISNIIISNHYDFQKFIISNYQVNT